MALERLAHTCAVVLAYKFQPAHAVRITGLAEAAAHPSAGVIVFDGVANDVDGCAYVVAHAAKEVRLGLVRRAGAAHLLLQTVLVVHLATLALLRGVEHQQRRQDRRQRVDAEGGDHHVLAQDEHVFIGEEHIQAVLLVHPTHTEKHTATV